MPGAGVAITLGVHDAEVQLGMKALSARLLLTRRRALTAIGGAMVTRTQERFEAERGPDGRPWKPLALATTRRIVSRGGRGKGRRGVRRGAQNILRVSSRLYNSITYEVPTTADRVRWGTNVKYAPLQQLGGTAQMQNRGARKVPARPFLGINASDKAEILAILTETMGEAIL